MTWRLAGLAGLFVASGALHLVRPQVFVRIVPRRLPARTELVYGSGVAELLCAAGLAVPATRAAAGWASAALLVGIFPANVQMTVSAVRSSRRRPADRRRRLVAGGTVVRLPLQWSLVRVALSAAGR
jgi:uncharacterized membrane protein